MSDVKPKLNNARVKTFGAYVVIHSFEPVLETPYVNIWKGIQLVQPEQRETVYPEVYFSRLYSPDINDLDKIFPEIVWDDCELIGVPCLFVQKEKLLFGYQPSSTILLPAPKQMERPRQM
jgi:hypothetical protein